MKYLEPSFSMLPPAGKEYRDNWDQIFSKEEKPAEDIVLECKYDLNVADVSYAPDVQRLIDAVAKYLLEGDIQNSTPTEKELVAAFFALK